MPESLKPYDPNKSWIEWKLDPEEIKEKLLSLIPYRNTLEYFHNNPNAPISETLSMAAHETPILGSLLAGEPTDAAKEAILLGVPVKATSAKKQLSKLHPDTKFGRARGYDALIYAKEPNARKYKAYSIDDNTGILTRNSTYDGPAKYFDAEILGNSEGFAEFNKSIDYTNAMFDKVPSLKETNPIRIANKDIGEPYSMFNEYHIRANKGPDYNSIGTKIEEYNDMKDLYNEASKAKPKKGEVVKLRVPKDYNYTPVQPIVLYNPKTNNYRTIGNSDILSGNNYIFRDIPDKNLFDYDMKVLNNEIKQRNIRSQFEDDVIEYKSGKQYYNDYKDAYNAYIDALNGPYLEDILGVTNRYKGREKLR